MPEAFVVLLVHRHDEDHPGLLRQVLHPLRRRPVRDELRVAVVLLVLHLAEVGPVEQLLEQHHLRALLGRLVRECSCFWIIDSLSPVQVACSSAPRTFRGIETLLEWKSARTGPREVEGYARSPAQRQAAVPCR